MIKRFMAAGLTIPPITAPMWFWMIMFTGGLTCYVVDHVP